MAIFVSSPMLVICSQLYEKSMYNYISAKLQVSQLLKWSVCEKFRDYLIGSKFTVLTDNNPLTYVSHFSFSCMSQIHWLSDLALFRL